jgi:hypothetical protein
MIDGRAILMVLAISVVALLVGIDGLLKGEWLRALGGWGFFALMLWLAFVGVPYLSAKLDRQLAEVAARPTSIRSWPVIVAGALFGLACLAGAGAILFAPFEYLLDWSRSTRGLFLGLAAVVGEIGARLVVAALFLFAAFAALKTTWLRIQAR